MDVDQAGRQNQSRRVHRVLHFETSETAWNFDRRDASVANQQVPSAVETCCIVEQMGVADQKLAHAATPNALTSRVLLIERPLPDLIRNGGLRPIGHFACNLQAPDHWAGMHHNSPRRISRQPLRAQLIPLDVLREIER